MPKTIDDQARARCVRLVNEHQQECPTLTVTVSAVARQEGASNESVHFQKHSVAQSSLHWW